MKKPGNKLRLLKMTGIIIFITSLVTIASCHDKLTNRANKAIDYTDRSIYPIHIFRLLTIPYYYIDFISSGSSSE